jgi:flagellum-specific ATP synthase
MIQAGLYTKGSDATIDMAMQIWPALDAFLSEDAPADGVAGSFRRLATVLSR